MVEESSGGMIFYFVSGENRSLCYRRKVHHRQIRWPEDSHEEATDLHFKKKSSIPIIGKSFWGHS